MDVSDSSEAAVTSSPPVIRTRGDTLCISRPAGAPTRMHISVTTSIRAAASRVLSCCTMPK